MTYNNDVPHDPQSLRKSFQREIEETDGFFPYTGYDDERRKVLKKIYND